jgi:hypothetical protein
MRKFSWVSNVTGRVICPTSVTMALGTIPRKGTLQDCSAILGRPIWSIVFRNRMLIELPPSTRTRLILLSLMMGLMIRGYRPDVGMKSGPSLRLTVMDTSDHFRYSGLAGPTVMTSRAVSFYFLLDSHGLGLSKM